MKHRKMQIMFPLKRTKKENLKDKLGFDRLNVVVGYLIFQIVFFFSKLNSLTLSHHVFKHFSIPMLDFVRFHKIICCPKL